MQSTSSAFAGRSAQSRAFGDGAAIRDTSGDDAQPILDALGLTVQVLDDMHSGPRGMARLHDFHFSFAQLFAGVHAPLVFDGAGGAVACARSTQPQALEWVELRDVLAVARVIGSRRPDAAVELIACVLAAGCCPWPADREMLMQALYEQLCAERQRLASGRLQPRTVCSGHVAKLLADFATWPSVRRMLASRQNQPELARDAFALAGPLAPGFMAALCRVLPRGQGAERFAGQAAELLHDLQACGLYGHGESFYVHEPVAAPQPGLLHVPIARIDWESALAKVRVLAKVHGAHRLAAELAVAFIACRIGPANWRAAVARDCAAWLAKAGAALPARTCTLILPELAGLDVDAATRARLLVAQREAAAGETAHAKEEVAQPQPPGAETRAAIRALLGSQEEERLCEEHGAVDTLFAWAADGPMFEARHEPGGCVFRMTHARPERELLELLAALANRHRAPQLAAELAACVLAQGEEVPIALVQACEICLGKAGAALAARTRRALDEKRAALANADSRAVRLFASDEALAILRALGVPPSRAHDLLCDAVVVALLDTLAKAVNVERDSHGALRIARRQDAAEPSRSSVKALAKALGPREPVLALELLLVLAADGTRSDAVAGLAVKSAVAIARARKPEGAFAWARSAAFIVRAAQRCKADLARELLQTALGAAWAAADKVLLEDALARLPVRGDSVPAAIESPAQPLQAAPQETIPALSPTATAVTTTVTPATSHAAPQPSADVLRVGQLFAQLKADSQRMYERICGVAGRKLVLYNKAGDSIRMSDAALGSVSMIDWIDALVDLSSMGGNAGVTAALTAALVAHSACPHELRLAVVPECVMALNLLGVAKRLPVAMQQPLGEVLKHLPNAAVLLARLCPDLPGPGPRPAPLPLQSRIPVALAVAGLKTAHPVLHEEIFGSANPYREPLVTQTDVLTAGAKAWGSAYARWESALHALEVWGFAELAALVSAALAVAPQAPPAQRKEMLIACDLFLNACSGSLPQAMQEALAKTLAATPLSSTQRRDFLASLCPGTQPLDTAVKALLARVPLGLPEMTLHAIARQLRELCLPFKTREPQFELRWVDGRLEATATTVAIAARTPQAIQDKVAELDRLRRKGAAALAACLAAAIAAHRHCPAPLAARMSAFIVDCMAMTQANVAAGSVSADAAD